MIAPKESKSLRKTLKRTSWFLVGVFVVCLAECFLLQLTGISAVWNGFILIVTASILYLLFLLICAKIDKKREKRDAEEKHRDPFSH